MRSRLHRLTGLCALVLAAGCGAGDEADMAARDAAGPPTPSGPLFELRDTTIDAVLDAAGVAEPYQRATLSTRLMGAVTAVVVREGDPVVRGAVLARIDARDVAARQARVQAGVTEAEAVHRDAETQAARFRALYADSAATRAQLDAAETGVARARAGLEAARAGAGELEALGSDAAIRAPFAGIVTERFVDRGAFVAPGAPVVTVEDASRLRVSVVVTPGVAAALSRGDQVAASIEGRPAQATVEGIAPAGGSLYTVNAIVDNRGGAHPSGGSAVLHLPTGRRPGLLLPERALVREGDLVGVRVVTGAGTQLRWIRTGARHSGRVEVLAGLRAGERVLMPASAPASASEGAE